MGSPKNELTNYIWTYLQQGYPLASIKERLISQGYKLKEINAAIDYVYANYYYSQQPNSPQQARYPVSQGHPSTNNIILISIVILGIILLITAVSLLIFGNGSNSTNQPSFPQSPIEKPIVVLPVENENPSTIETPSIQKNESPAAIPVPPPSNNQVILGDSPEKYNPSQVYTKRQLDLLVEQMSLYDYNEALKYCVAYPSEVEREYCTSTVAEYSLNIGLCERISSESIKDDCYLKIILDENADGTYCNNIRNAYKRDNCMRFVEAMKMRDSTIQIETSENRPEDAINYYAVTAQFY
jgi:hypothetical protein